MNLKPFVLIHAQRVLHCEILRYSEPVCPINRLRGLVQIFGLRRCNEQSLWREAVKLVETWAGSPIGFVLTLAGGDPGYSRNLARCAPNDMA